MRAAQSFLLRDKLRGTHCGEKVLAVRALSREDAREYLTLLHDFLFSADSVLNSHSKPEISAICGIFAQ